MEVGWGETGWAFQFGEQLGHPIRILKEYTLWPNQLLTHRGLSKGHEHKDKCLRWFIAAWGGIPKIGSHLTVHPQEVD